MAPATSFGELFTLSLNVANAENIFAFYIGALLLLAYFLSLCVSYLHIRKDSVVYPLTQPQAGSYFSEYIVKIRTSLKLGSSFDYRGRVIIQLIGSFADSVPLHLKKGKGIEYFFERGATNIFVYHSPCILGDITEIKLTLVNDAPHEIPYVEWRPSHICVLQPASRLRWSTKGIKLLCPDILKETLACKKETSDTLSAFKSLCLFDIWISMMHSPVRFGTYSNFVNVIVIFFVISAVLNLSLLCELGLHLKVLPNVPEILVEGKRGEFLRLLVAVGTVWIVEVVSEAIFRNTVPRVSASKYSKFHGLMEPVESAYGVEDFTIDYDWDKVWPLIPKKRVIVPYGNRHASAHNVFKISPVHSYFNFWGLMGLEDEREGNWFTRSMNMCALPLPLSMKWLAKEGWGIKEERLVKQYISDFQSPMCYFCCWLLDWPLHYVDDPQQAGLIFSHIICKDILSITKMSSKTQRARLAQICLHQWHGLFCCIFLYNIKQNLELKNEPSSALESLYHTLKENELAGLDVIVYSDSSSALEILGKRQGTTHLGDVIFDDVCKIIEIGRKVKSFIHRNISTYGKRSAREIQASWKKRQIRLKEMQLQSIQGKLSPDSSKAQISAPNEQEKVSTMSSKTQPSNINASAKTISSLPWNFIQNLWYKKARTDEASCSPPLITHHDIIDDVDVVEDQLNFVIDKVTFETGDWKASKALKVAGAASVEMCSEGNMMKEGGGEKRNRRFMCSRKDSGPVGSTFKTDHEIVEVDTNINALVADANQGETSSCQAGDQMPLEEPGANIDKRANAAKNINSNAKTIDSLTGIAEVKNSKSKDVDTKVAEMLLEKNAQSFDPKNDAKDRLTLPISDYETVPLGPPYDTTVAHEPDPHNPSLCLRHRHEILGYCCGSKRCASFAEIHKKVGHCSLEILRKMLQDLLHFAMDSDKIESLEKLWKRKNMVFMIYSQMEKKLKFFDNNTFLESLPKQEEGFKCNQLMTSSLITLETLVSVVLRNKDESWVAQMLQRRRKFGVRPKPIRRCVFCARELKIKSAQVNEGCDSLEKLVKFFSRDTIYVSEKEINVELKYKVTVQNYCAMMMNVAKKEVMMELEDPPMVLSTKVTRAMIHKLLEDMLPKHTSFKDMTADELRRIGTRRERIQARHDPTAKASQRETPEEKKRKQMIQTVLEDLGNKWRVSVKENELHYCSLLLAQCLVQERILGFSLYSGLISKEHEIILDNSRSRLGEVEKKAYHAILRVANKVLHPRLKKVIQAGSQIDVLFPKFKLEAAYTMEAINVTQVLAEPAFLKTCCYYVNNIVDIKIEEFKEFMGYLKGMHPAKDIGTTIKLKMMRAKYLIDEPFVEQEAVNHGAISSPIMRWGPIAIKGIPPLPKELKITHDSNVKFDELLPKVLNAGTKNENMEQVTARILKARRKLKCYLDLNDLEKARKLEIHLGKVQANLIEQIALASQNIADTYTQEIDYQREYHREELFNVELYATGNLKVLFCPAMGTLLCTILMLVTLTMMFFTTFKTSQMQLSDVKIWFKSSLLALLGHILILEPIKCILYSFFRMYID